MEKKGLGAEEANVKSYPTVMTECHGVPNANKHEHEKNQQKHQSIYFYYQHRLPSLQRNLPILSTDKLFAHLDRSQLELTVASELSFLRYPEATAAVTGVQLQVSTQVPFPLNKQLSHDALQEPEAMGQTSLAEVSETCKV
jgi:hypothetical protein